MDAYYDCISQGYADLHGEEQLKKIRIMKNHLPPETTSLLDVGCGPSLADWGTWSVGIDTSFALLRKAHGVVVQARAESLPFRDHSFDAVVSVTAIQNFGDMQKAILEMKRVGRNFFAISYLKRSSKAEEIEELLEQEFHIAERIIEDKDIIIIASSISRKEPAP